MKGWGQKSGRPCPARSGVGRAQALQQKPLPVNQGQHSPQAPSQPHPQEHYPDSPEFGRSFLESLIRSSPSNVSPSLIILQQRIVFC